MEDYKLKYIGYFKDINNQDVEVNFFIKCDNCVNVEEIQLATEPVTINYNTDGDPLKTLKLSSATIRIITPKLLTDLFASNPLKVMVKIYKNFCLHWVGFVTPNVYTQDFFNVNDVLEIECIDCISVLENIDYKPLNNSNTLLSFMNYIKNIFSNINYLINDIYFINHTKLNSTDSNFCIFNDLNVEEKNFTIDTVSCKDVLEQILKYLNLQIVQWKKSFYIYDVNLIVDDVLKKNYSIKNHINISGGTFSSFTFNNQTITDYDYQDCDATVSIGEVYRNFKLKCNTEKTEDFGKDLFEDFEEGNMRDWIFNKSNTELYHIYKRTLTPKTTAKLYYYKYNSSLGDFEEVDKSENYDAGIEFARWGNFKIGEITHEMQFTECLTQTHNAIAYSQSGKRFNHPIFAVTLDYYIPKPQNDVFYAVLNGDFYNTNYDFIYDGEGEEYDYDYGTVAQLKVSITDKDGNVKYLNQSFSQDNIITYNWVSSPTTFGIKYSPQINSEKLKLYKWYSFDDQRIAEMGLSKGGILFPIRLQDNVSGTLKFEFYNVPVGRQIGQELYILNTFYKDITVDIIKVNQLDAKETEKEFEYTIDTENGAISNYEDLEIDINTYNENKTNDLSFSFVVDKNNKLLKLLNVYEYKNKQLINYSRIPEEHYLMQYSNHYSKPNIIYNATIKDESITPFSYIYEPNVDKKLFVGDVTYNLWNNNSNAMLYEI